MARISLKILFYDVRYLRQKSDWYLVNKEAITLDEDPQEHYYTLWFHYEVNNNWTKRMVKEEIAKWYRLIFSKLNEFKQDLQEEQKYEHSSS